LSGLYIHIPFCRKACIYCNFHFSTSLKRKTELIQAIILELNLRKDYVNNDIIKTIYLGGGTPSVLEVGEIKLLLEVIYKNYNVAHQPEITLEANPEDLEINYLSELINLGINRLSIGVQSFFEEDLKYLGRVHSALQAEKAVLDAREAGFVNISIDMIYGIPGLSIQRWRQNLEKITNFDIPHFSAYCLTKEPKTILDYQVRKKIKSQTDDELIRSHFFELLDFTSKYDYRHYEISNFCKDGFFSKHNSAYWLNEPYLGTGPSAHSYDLISRQWNIAINSEYIARINSGIPYFEKEILSEKDKFNEYLMLSLRTSWGANLKKLGSLIDEAGFDVFYKSLKHYIDQDKIIQNDDFIYFTPEGILLSDGILSDLFIE
jgi:oxygen-independent coproporphyrinogen III oxidase